MHWPAAVLFDLDGTLADSVPDIAHAVDATMTHLGHPAPGVAAVRDWVGDGVGPLLDRALEQATGEAPDSDGRKAAMDRFLVSYAENLCVDSTLYPGIENLVEELAQHKVPLGVVTNKPAAFTEPLLEQLGIASYFGVCISGDTLERRKPDPLPVTHACETLGVDVHRSVMVGDSPNDARAAQAAGAGAILMTWGYNVGVDLNSLDADAVLDSADALHDVLTRWARD